MMNAIEIKNLCKQYQQMFAVNNLNLNIQQGELFSLLGVNGAGKTTTLKMLATLTTPTSGDALLLSKSIVKDKEAVKTLIGIAPQDTAIASNLNVKENLELMCGIYGYNRKQREIKIKELINEFHFENVLDKKTSQLSGGWKRRLSIAMALVGDPQILFLDEPTLGLDVIARSELWDTIKALKGKMTIILTTHYMEEAEALSDHIGIMKEGKLIALGTSEGLKAMTHQNKFEDAFVALVKGDYSYAND